MEKRKLGQSSLELFPLALGTNVFGWTIDEPSSFELLDAFTGEGFSFIDTADVYSRWGEGNKGGESETIIGNWLRKSGKRKDVIIATKVGSDMGQGKIDLTKEYIIRAAEDSLRRLQTDTIDLYQTHFDDNTTPVEETLAAYDQLIREGKVRYIGASNLTPGRLKDSLKATKEKGLPRYESFQPEYNLYSRDSFEGELQQLCIRENLGVITYFSLAAGFLTGKYRGEADLHKSKRGHGMDKYFTPRGFRILDALDQVAARHSVTPATVALAWLIAQPGVTAPISSATSLKQLNTLTEAAKLQLDKESLQQLTDASAY
ncbi:MAG: alcohol dehydrogenase [Sphingobacteriales bacterium SCN 48-20]|uniref:aldo/keto reductase n=1 Tax=Terrimonas ferruginea TaxID=249 RepID=UPI00086B3AF0|nr:aldo/keto reductase [Terrimonas ferruginea]MBN8781809.1 aldo/keto reductase [Terrimonas ferruginea]ODT90853.1 MAG: alcohol dehydrogenase [Sphingobacteriales bacterium SCN 48-20]OJW44954.1 MAG: alcohol dehydrogenase [Sphingobacteriales bacterium 48-107]